MKTRYHNQRRKGNVLAITILMMVGMFAILAFAVDLGYLQLARTELQRSADAAAIAGTWELIDEDALFGNGCPWYTEYSARTTAAQYAALNKVTSQNPALALEDVVIGYLADPFDPNSQISPVGANPANAVQVRVRKTLDQNGGVPLFFARALGFDQTDCQASATAVLMNNIRGFGVPTSGQNLEILPYALDQDTWNDLLAGIGSDNWTWDAESEQVSSGADGILEVNLFPQSTGSPGNRGTVDIGSSNNSTADIARQIVDGISEQDMSHHGGTLELDVNGELSLNGDTGISAGVKDELASIRGDPRIVPIFSQVSGPGNNAQYTIVAFVGIRIMEVKLTGKMSSKRVTIQPAIVTTHGAIPGSGPPASCFVYSPVWLTR